jgi:hypothetical protein
MTDRRRRVMSVANRSLGAKSRGWPYLAVLVLALGSSYAGRAVAQQQSANPPLPSVVYPIRDPDTGPVDRTTPDITPEPALPIVQGPPLRRYATRLPNWPAGAIVIRPSSQPDRRRER